MGGNAGQTFYEINNYSFTQDNCKYVYFYMHLFPLPWSPINQLKAVKKIATDCVFAKVLSQNQAAE